MKILINCPGGWSHGLDSPERGEGRWAQNLARCLSKIPEYEVSACSGGIPTWGRGVRANVQILSEREAGKRGPYDLYFDASWWDKKEPVAKARAYFHVHFGFEGRLGIPFPANHHLVYVLKSSAHTYVGEGRGNADRTFYLPAPFRESMAPPDPSRRGILTTIRTSFDDTQRARFEMLKASVKRLREQGHNVPLVWIEADAYRSPVHPQDRVLRKDAAWGIPYNELRAELGRCALNAAMDGWASVLDATAMGIPSLGWEGGIDPTPAQVANRHGLLLRPDADLDRLTEVLSRLLFDPELQRAYVQDMQAGFPDHIEPVTLAHFRSMVERVLG